MKKINRRDTQEKKKDTQESAVQPKREGGNFSHQEKKSVTFSHSQIKSTAYDM